MSELCQEAIDVVGLARTWSHPPRAWSEVESLYKGCGCPSLETAKEFLSKFEGLKFFAASPLQIDSRINMDEMIIHRPLFKKDTVWVNLDLEEVCDTYSQEVEGDVYSRVLNKEVTPIGEVITSNGVESLVIDQVGLIYAAVFGSIGLVGKDSEDAINRLVLGTEYWRTSPAATINFDMSEYS